MAEQVYQVVDDDKQVIFTGTAEQIKDLLGFKRRSSVSSYATSHYKMRGKYELVPIGRRQKEKEINNDHLKWQMKQLDRFRNTVAVGDPNKNIKDLSELGYECESKMALYGKKKRYSLWLK